MGPFIVFIVAFVLETGVSAVQVTLTDNGPAVRGANVTFTATIVSDYTGENFKFVFTDNGVPQHKQEIQSTNQTVNYSVEYFRDTYEAGQYNVHLEVKRNYFENLWWTVATAFTAFNLTETPEAKGENVGYLHECYDFSFGIAKALSKLSEERGHEAMHKISQIVMESTRQQNSSDHENIINKF